MAKTHVDWFGFRAKDGPDVMASALTEVMPKHFELSLAKRKTGWRSFESSYDLWLTDTRGNPETDCCRIGMAMSGGRPSRAGRCSPCPAKAAAGWTTGHGRWTSARTNLRASS